MNEQSESPDVQPSTTPTSTGNAVVDEALQRLNSLAERPVTEHPAEFEAVHDVLRDVLDA